MISQRFLKIFVILASISISVLFIELFLTLFYEQKLSGPYKLDGLTVNKHFTFNGITGYSLVPNISDNKRSIHTDAFGFRKTSRAYDASKKSIIFVGDSTVFGWGVKDEETFVYKLSIDPVFDRFNVINMGVPSYSLSNIVATIRNVVPKYNPEIVVISVLWPWGPVNKMKNKGMRDDYWEILDLEFYRTIFQKRDKYVDDHPWRPKIILFMRDIYYGIRYKDEIKGNLTRPGVDDFSMNREQEEQYAMVYIRSLLQVTEYLRSQNVRVIFYVHPYSYTVFDPKYLNLGKYGYEILISNLNSVDLKYLLRSTYRGKNLYLDGCHLTPEGNDVFKNIMTQDIIPLVK